jgi:WD40 repeat protein
LSAVAVDPVNGGTVYTGSRDYHVKGWNAETGAKTLDVHVPRNIITTMAVNSTGNLVFQGSEDLCVRAWDVRSSARAPAIHLTSYVYFPLSLSLHSGDNYMVTGCKGFDGVGCEVKLWDLRKTSQPILEMHGHRHDVTSCTFSRLQSHRVVSASKDGSICVWDCSKNMAAANATTDAEHSSSPQAYQITTGKYYTCMTQSTRSNNAKKETYYLGSFDGCVSTVSVPTESGPDSAVKLSVSIEAVTTPYFAESGGIEVEGANEA